MNGGEITGDVIFLEIIDNSLSAYMPRNYDDQTHFNIEIDGPILNNSHLILLEE